MNAQTEQQSQSFRNHNMCREERTRHDGIILPVGADWNNVISVFAEACRVRSIILAGTVLLFHVGYTSYWSLFHSIEKGDRGWIIYIVIYFQKFIKLF